MDSTTAVGTQNLDGNFVAHTLHGNWHWATPASFAGVCFDSRSLKAGELFVALKGARHGHEFLSIAAQKGAAGAIVETLQPVEIPQIVVPDSLKALQDLSAAWRKNWGAQPDRKLVAVTGSSGKTSTKELLAHLLGETTHKTQGNFNNHIGLPVTILGLPAAATRAVIEAGVGGIGEMAPLEQISAPDAALLTLIGSAHLEFFKSQEVTALEKGQLLAAVPANGLVVLHAREVAYTALQNLKAKVIALGSCPGGVSTPKNYKFIDISSTSTSTGWVVNIEGHPYTLPLWTPGMVENACLCIALTFAWGVPAKTIQERLHSWPGVSLRGLWMRYKNAPEKSRIYFDAYNSNPEALADSLWRFHRMTTVNTPRWYIIGTMGELGADSAALHTESAAKIALRPTDCAWTVGDKATELAAGLAQAGATAPQIKTAATLAEIQEKLKTFEGEVFIKGSHGTGLHTLAAEMTAI